MPIAVSAERSQPTDSPAKRRLWSLRRPLGLLIALAVLFPAAAMDVVPTEAGGSCTGWQSNVVPPNSIRVLRSDGRVEKVNFRRYVAVVMGTGEWPGSMPQAALEVGAVAVKQFAWYHSMAGRHRRGFYNARGQCYDVRDTTADQLYRPERARITSKQLRAIDKTWAVSLRRNGNFFLTQYRSGQRRACGADADGRKLFQRSLLDCVRRGWGANRIFARYYGPNVSLVRAGAHALALSAGSNASSTASASSSTPAATRPAAPARPGAPGAPSIGLRTGRAIGSAPAVLTWSQSASSQAAVRYELQQRVGRQWQNVKLAKPGAASLSTGLRTDSTHQFRVRAVAGSGAASEWVSGLTVSARQIEDRSAKIAWRGNWQRMRKPSFSGGEVRYSGLAGSSATFRFTGRAVALVGARGPGRGKAFVYVNGTLAAKVDLFAVNKNSGVVFFARNWKQAGTRTIRLEVRGTGDRNRIDLDSILTLR